MTGLHAPPFLAKLLRKFVLLGDDKRGSATPVLLFGLMAALGIAALVTEVSRLFVLHGKLRSTTEMVAMTVAKNLYFLQEGELASLGQTVLTANLSGERSSFARSEFLTELSLNMMVDPSSGRIDIETRATAPTFFLNAFGLLEDKILSASVSVRTTMPEMQLVLVLDSSHQTEILGKLDEIKTTAVNFIEMVELYQMERGPVKFALVPYGGPYVNVAPHKEWVEAADWPVRVPPFAPGTKSWEGPLEEERWCVAPRPGAAGETDIPPDQVKFPLVLDILIDFDTGTILPHYFVATTTECRSVRVQPLAGGAAHISPDIFALQGVGDFQPGRGMIWAERVLSEAWQSSWQTSDAPPPQSQQADGALRDEKVVVLVAGSDTGDHEYQAGLLTGACDRLKANDVKIFVVEFQPYSVMTDPLRRCATSPGYYFAATSGAALQEVFWLITRFLAVVKASS